MFEEEYDSLETVPDAVKHLFVMSGDKAVLLSSSQLRTEDDIERVQEGLRKERQDHKGTKVKLSAFKGLDATDIHDKLDRFDELEIASKGKLDDNQINDMVESRIKSRVAPLERQINQLTDQKGELEGEIVTYKGKDKKRAIHDHIRTASVKAKVRDTALEDVLIIGERIFEVEEGTGRVVTKDNVGITPGIDATVWLSEVKENRPHWWPESKGAGLKGGPGGRTMANNPFSKEHWNMTEQGKLVKEDRARADQFAKSAGTTVGGPKPK